MTAQTTALSSMAKHVVTVALLALPLQITGFSADKIVSVGNASSVWQ